MEIHQPAVNRAVCSLFTAHGTYSIVKFSICEIQSNMPSAAAHILPACGLLAFKRPDPINNSERPWLLFTGLRPHLIFPLKFLMFCSGNNKYLTSLFLLVICWGNGS